MLEAIKYNLAHLLDFSGREDRPTFWWYILFLVILDFVLGLIISGPLVAGSISAAMSAAESGASQEAVQSQVLQQVGSQMGSMVWISAGIGLLMICLSTAAFVRRLHDSGNSGWWAALAIASRIVAFALSLSVVGTVRNLMASGNVDQLMQQQAHLSRYGLIGWIAPLVVVVFGVMKSTEGPNRYGEATPAR